jgi:hypothetical protein
MARRRAPAPALDPLLDRSSQEAAWDEEASTPCLELPATMWSSHRLTSAPAWDSGAGVGRLPHWSHPGGGVSSSGISTAVASELPTRAGPCGGAAASAAGCATAASDSCYNAGELAVVLANLAPVSVSWRALCLNRGGFEGEGVVVYWGVSIRARRSR